MFIIVDNSGTIQDIASERANLSRGKTFRRYKEFETSEPVRIGDRFRNGKAIRQPESVNYEELIAVEIEDMNRKTAISRLKNKGRIPPTFRDI